MGNFTNTTFEIDGKVATLTLNRPEALNSMTFDLIYEIQDALKIIDEKMRTLSSFTPVAISIPSTVFATAASP